MTYREKRERRAARREDWAASRRAKQGASFAAAERLASQIPLGQPILVGHHSERHARRDAERIQTGMTRGVEHGKMAAHHGQAADTIRQQLDQSIYRDDVDAVERLEEKLAGLEGERDRTKEINTWLQKNRKRHGFTAGRLPGWTSSEDEVRRVAALFAECSQAIELTTEERDRLMHALEMRRIGMPGYVLSNLGGNISRARQRLEEARARRQVHEALATEANA